jgi:hypothetical protein
MNDSEMNLFLEALIKVAPTDQIPVRFHMILNTLKSHCNEPSEAVINKMGYNTHGLLESLGVKISNEYNIQ